MLIKLPARLLLKSKHFSIETSINAHHLSNVTSIKPWFTLYSSTVWDPHTSSNINRLEAVQRSAARMCLNSFSRYSSVTVMLNGLELPSLHSRRFKSKLQMLYKIIHNLVDIPSDCLQYHYLHFYEMAITTN